MLEIFKFKHDNVLFDQARAIRNEVFIKEQKVDREIEFEHEEESVHFLGFYEDDAIATARYRETDEGIKLERFATLEEFRNKNVGAAMLSRVLEDVLPLKKKVYLNSQLKAVPFYKRHGFEEEGEHFFEADIEHVKMVFRGEEG
jgi:predicted GNAT family N-acyltransferase